MLVRKCLAAIGDDDVELSVTAEIKAPESSWFKGILCGHFLHLINFLLFRIGQESPFKSSKNSLQRDREANRKP